MALENKLDITEAAELAREEEKISKAKALELFETGRLDTFEASSFEELARIHQDASYHYEGYTAFKTEELKNHKKPKMFV